LFKNLRKNGFNSDSLFYTIAEIGINHNGNIDLAKKMIDSAANARANAVKFQTYITEKRVNKNSPIYNILKECELSFRDFEILKNHALNVGIDFFSTPFDNESVNCLNELDIDLYKIASFDVTNHKLLRAIAKINKPVIMSTGMCDIEEIKSGYNVISEEHNNIAILHCISAYPTKHSESNLLAINSLRGYFDCIIGQSDHTNDIVVPLYSAAMGAQILEKHFMIDDKVKCVDASVSITEKQMLDLNNKLNELTLILGSGNIGLSKAQESALQFRRFSI